MKRELKSRVRMLSIRARLKRLGRLLLTWIRAILVEAVHGRLVIFSLLAYVLGRAPLVPEVYPFGLALFAAMLRRKGPLASFVLLLCASHGMATHVPSGAAKYWWLVGIVTWCISGLPLWRSARLEHNTTSPFDHFYKMLKIHALIFGESFCILLSSKYDSFCANLYDILKATWNMIVTNSITAARTYKIGL